MHIGYAQGLDSGGVFAVRQLHVFRLTTPATETLSQKVTVDPTIYPSPDGLLYAQVIPTKKNLLGDPYESKVEIRTKEGTVLQTADYTSEDGNHGLIVNRAEWTYGRQFFVYNGYSSGGHQPWFSPVFFYNRFDNKIYDFSKVSGFIVASPEFIATFPDTVIFEVYTCSVVGPTTIKSFNLNDVISNPPAHLPACQ